MTVSERELAHIHADNLATVKNFYPSRVPVGHHQLRRLVSYAQEDLIFYVDKHDIYVLDLRSNQRTLLSTIPFEARCLAAGYGWVCVGGESNADCAFIKVDCTDSIPKCFGHDLDVQVLGGEIVNSMNIHLLQDTPEAEPEPVVLISNNDRTVKIYSLLQRQVLTVLEHDKPMNHATISPDSKILAAVGDSDRVYFYQRKRIHPESNRPYPQYDWRPMAIPTIPIGSSVFDDHAFAVAFSPSGDLCAASAAGGAVSVFDMRLMVDPKRKPEDATLCTFRSSRPTLWGCVRSMAFSPPPWDLLAWAEDHGRIGIADVRQGCIRRQTLQLDKDKSNAVDIEDSTPSGFRDLSIKEKLKEQHLARLRSMREAAPELSRSNSLLVSSRTELDQAMRRRQDLISYHRGLDLDAREQSVLEALETSMDDVEHRTQPYSVSYTSSPRVRPSQSAELAGNAADYEVQLLNPSARHGPRIHQPRRRTSVVLSESSTSRHLAPPESSRTRISESPARMTDDELPTMSTNDLTPSRSGSSTQPLPYNIPSSDPWDVIQSALENARQTDSSRASIEGRPATLAQIEAALEAERELGTQLERQLADERQLSDLLRRQLETQEQLLQSQQRELEAERNANLHLEPSIERLLQRELRSEQQFGEQRSQDLETEMRLGNNRARRLHLERARLLQAAATAQAASAAHTSAQTTTLPTTNTTLDSSNDNPASASTLQRHEAYRRQRLAHIENLERQVRRAESRVASAASDIQALESAIQRNHLSDRLTRQSDIRTQAARVANLSTGTLNASSVRSEQRRQLHMSAVRQQARQQGREVEGGQTPSSRFTSELAGRTLESERRMAQLMFAQATRAASDSNGNWLSGGQMQRMYHEARGVGMAGTATVAEVQREMGLGTTGIGWSQNGRRLFCGTEEGIFEFAVNLKDRLQFPSLEMRSTSQPITTSGTTGSRR